LWNRNQQAEEREGEGRKTIRKNNGQFFSRFKKKYKPPNLIIYAFQIKEKQ
jgi:hypothetical protein